MKDIRYMIDIRDIRDVLQQILVILFYLYTYSLYI